MQLGIVVEFFPRNPIQTCLKYVKQSLFIKFIQTTFESMTYISIILNRNFIYFFTLRFMELTSDSGRISNLK